MAGNPLPRPLRLASILVLASAVAIGVALIFGQPGGPIGERAAITAERARRLATVTANETLPGTPDLGSLPQRLAAHGLQLGAPVFIRIFKREFALELWLQRDGRFHLFETYPVCRWSGWLGPKLAQGDRQTPEGFYTVAAGQLNPNSRWHRSFNLGFPNAFDRAHGRTGSFLMVHGGCSSAGCFAMTDPVIDEIWQLVSAALKAGQPRFHVHAYPFALTEENLERHAASPWASFWRDLKAGSDAFEATGLPPRVEVCEGRYVSEPASRVGEAAPRQRSACTMAASGPRPGRPQ